MSWNFMLETVFLLAAAQLMLGATGFVTRGWPWLGLVLLPLFVWIIHRVARVLRDEIRRTQKKAPTLDPGGVASVVAVLWQLPALILAPLWAPEWVTTLWHGAVLPLPAVFGVTPGGWLWLATLAEGALFIWLVVRPNPKLQGRITPAQSYQKSVGEWAVARRRDDVLALRGKKTEE